jgi:hypothetical protein
VRRAKRECWEKYIQSVEGDEVYKALRFTSPRMAATTPALRDENNKVAVTLREKEAMVRENHFPKPPPSAPYRLPDEGSGQLYQTITDKTVEKAIFTQSVRKAAGLDRLNFRAIRLLWSWDSRRVTALVRACIRKGAHPWKVAKGVLLKKPNKPDREKVKSYRTISLLSCLGKVVEKVMADEIADWGGIERSPPQGTDGE